MGGRREEEGGIGRRSERCSLSERRLEERGRSCEVETEKAGKRESRKEKRQIKRKVRKTER